MKVPTLEYKIPEQNRMVIEYRYTPFCCADISCRYSEGAVITLLLNPIDERLLICQKCGGKLIWDHRQKDFVERFERPIWD
jgi:hypothetical protein